MSTTEISGKGKRAGARCPVCISTGLLQTDEGVGVAVASTLPVLRLTMGHKVEEEDKGKLLCFGSVSLGIS